MLVSERKPWDEILKSLEGEKNIFLVACGGCSEACQTGGEKGLEELKIKLQENGKNITGSLIVDFACNKVLVALKLKRYTSSLYASDSILVTSCGIGVQAIANMVELPVHPADNTIYMGGFPGVWPGEERCIQCGDCRLDMTGGICPFTNCPKNLLNGACGGSDKGKCEVDPEKDCAWTKIYERLKQTGKLDNLRKISSPRNWNLMQPPEKRKKSIFWALEFEEEEKEKEVVK
ncbi:methylenetetrahydrofolate reductase C-terminal domain-containing protein [Candidatus Aerophobetes bacterium]|nr:methylenetetrahydrofolate reductase C-terminal domain-containing protein [Candidatus Aerophobetes bacterium]